MYDPCFVSYAFIIRQVYERDETLFVYIYFVCFIFFVHIKSKRTWILSYMGKQYKCLCLVSSSIYLENDIIFWIWIWEFEFVVYKCSVAKETTTQQAYYCCNQCILMLWTKTQFVQALAIYFVLWFGWTHTEKWFREAAALKWTNIFKGLALFCHR